MPAVVVVENKKKVVLVLRGRRVAALNASPGLALAACGGKSKAVLTQSRSVQPFLSLAASVTRGFLSSISIHLNCR